MAEIKITVTHKVGLHARPASLFVQTANKFSSKIMVSNLTAESNPVDAKSIIGILTLGVMQNHEILIHADGTDEESALQSISELVKNNFGES